LNEAITASYADLKVYGSKQFNTITQNVAQTMGLSVGELRSAVGKRTAQNKRERKARNQYAFDI